MNIAHVVCVFPPYKGGMGNSVLGFSKIYAGFGHKVTVFTPEYKKNSRQYSDQSGDNLFDYETNNNFKIEKLNPIFSYGNAAILPQLLWKLKKYDIVHFHHPFFGCDFLIIFAKFFFRQRFKLITHYHMDAIAEGLSGVLFKFNNFLFLNWLLKISKLITCASFDYIKHSQIKKFFHYYPKKFRQTAFGVNLEQFVIYHDHVNLVRKKMVVLFVGALDKSHYFKGLVNLLSAAKLLKNRGFDFELKIVGNGELKNFYQNQAKILGVSDITAFIDGVDDSKLVDFYNYCNVVVLPSTTKGEAFGLVLLEAMACGKPVIASNLPGVRSVFKNGLHGFLTKPNDIEDLTEKISLILKNKTKAEKMGKDARKFVEEKYSWEKVGETLDRIYHYVMYSI